MIIGTGLDMVDIRRIEESLARFGKRFEERVFTEGERQKANSRAGAGIRVVAGTYAKRFAAKEACAKALGTGISQGVYWKDMEVVNLPGGKPSLRLSERAQRRLDGLAPTGMKGRLEVTLTDEYPYAQAYVIAFAVVEF
jgi:holo-[acyl-carrier protein] synthase